MPDKLLADIRKVARQTHLSQQDVIRQSTKAGLPIVLKRHQSAERITNVDPLPQAEYRRIYFKRDELEGVSAQQLGRFQSQKEPD